MRSDGMMGIDWVWRLFGTPSDSSYENPSPERMNNSKLCFFLSAEDWIFFSQAMNDRVISQPLPTCPDVLLVP